MALHRPELSFSIDPEYMRLSLIGLRALLISVAFAMLSMEKVQIEMNESV